MSVSLHVEALAWLRFGKRMPLAATEAGAFNADVLGIDDTKSVEIEIKKSVADLRADFRDKTRKHWIYGHLKENGKAVWAPTFFWFFTYAKLGRQFLAVLDELDIKYAGLAVLDRESEASYGAGRNVSILRRAPRLHGNKPHPKLVRSVQLRMSSELTSLRLVMDLLKNATPEQVAAIVSEVTRISKELVGTPDWSADEEATVGQNGDGAGAVPG